MTLRPYQDMLNQSGISSGNTLLPDSNRLGKALMMSRGHTKNKAVTSVIIAGIVVWYLGVFLAFPFIGEEMMCLMFILFFAGPFVVGGGVLAFFSFLMGTLFGTPEFMVSDVVVRRGEELQIRFRQPVKRRVVLKSMEFALVLVESATYDQGSSTVTVTHEHVFQQDTKFDVEFTPEMGIDRSLTFHIPDNAMHSFEVTRNSLHWYIKVAFDIPNFPDFKQIYRIHIPAEVSHES